MKKAIIIRRLFQTLFYCLFIFVLWTASSSAGKLLRPESFFTIDPLIILATSISERVILPSVFFALVMVFLTFILGRFFCGWICPLGAIIDLSRAAARKIGLKRNNKSKKPRVIKFYILGVIGTAALFGVQIAWIMDPVVIAARFISLNFIPFLSLLINNLFRVLIQATNYWEPLYDFYHFLKQTFLGAKAYYFSNSLPVLWFFLILIATVLLASRFWCRYICPLGALYALPSKKALLKRHVTECVNCGKCVANCRMNAIETPRDYVKEECVLCMDCVYDCPVKGTAFSFGRTDEPEENKENRISRRGFLVFLAASFFISGYKFKTKRAVIRPPGALKENGFLNRCVRCGNCMKACPTNALHPVMFESGAQGIWTPKLIPEIGYCEYECSLCTTVCPTGAIPKIDLTKKKNTKLGIAKVNREICLAWKHKEECIVCEEHCPVPTKAIKLEFETVNGRRIPKPVVDGTLCIGCGICQNKCPVRPSRAIIVDPEFANRP